MLERHNFIEDIVVRIPANSFNCLKKFIENPVELTIKDAQLMQSLSVASPNLSQAIQNYEKLTPNKQRKCVSSLVRYLSRACTRCTPFGLFAGVGVAKIGNSTSITITGTPSKNAFLETECLLNISQFLSESDETRHFCHYYVNPTLYLIGDEYRYIETLFCESEVHYRYSSVLRNNSLDLIFTLRTSTFQWDDLVVKIESIGYTREEAEDFLHDLKNNQIIQSNLSFNIIGDSYFKRLSNSFNLFEVLTQNKVFNEVINELDELFDFKNFTSKESDRINQLYKEKLNTQMQDGRSKICFNQNIPLSPNSTISGVFMENIKEAIAFLIMTGVRPINSDIEKFKEIFLDVYGDNFVPLMTILDPEGGIGYPVFDDLFLSDISLISDFNLPNVTKGINLNNTDRRLLEKIITNEKCDEIVLTEDDFPNRHRSANLHLPEVLFVLFELLPDKDNRCISRLISFGDLFTCNIISRFAHSNPRIKDICSDLSNIVECKKLENSNIIAQIVHLPNCRSGNVIRHPHFFKYNIPISTYSLSEIENIIRLEDIYVAIIEDRVVLMSNSLGKEIIPVLNSAIDYRTSTMPVYKFLCDVSHQNDAPSLEYSFYKVKKLLRHIPRIKYKNVVLSPSTWKISSKEFSTLNGELDDSSILLKTSQIFKENDIPSVVYLENQDNRLYLDISIPNSIRASLPIMTNMDEVTFTEVLYNHKTSVVKDTFGDTYLNECVAFLQSIT